MHREIEASSRWSRAGLLALLAVALLLAGCPGDGKGPSPGPAADSTAARDLVRRYYAAIDGRDYASAYALWGERGRRSGQTYAQFAAGFARTAHSEVEFTGPVTFEGAAGSIFATVPVRVRARTTDGEDQEFAGTYDLRRANDVPGATPEQLRWHIHDAQLARTRRP